MGSIRVTKGLQSLWGLFLIGSVSTLVLLATPRPANTVPGENGRIALRAAADFIHAVIEANRTIYSGYIVDRLENTTQIHATENWESENTLLLPAQFLQKSSELSNRTETGVRYFLKSLWPINKNQHPKPGKEQSAFQAVANRPQEPVAWVEPGVDRSLYRIVYPDFATNASCTSCHNLHPDSPKRDFAVGDVMGGVVIEFPFDPQKESLAPEVVAEYVHDILQADRTVYSTLIVERLQGKGILRASQHWALENGLPLPAQYLAATFRLVRQKNLDMDFRLISLWPINKSNGPANVFERTGLKEIVRNPFRPFVETLHLAGNRYFRAIYPDLAVTPACIECHNANPNSPKRDFKLNDVMGGIAVTLAIE